MRDAPNHSSVFVKAEDGGNMVDIIENTSSMVENVTLSNGIDEIDVSETMLAVENNETPTVDMPITNNETEDQLTEDDEEIIEVENESEEDNQYKTEQIILEEREYESC